MITEIASMVPIRLAGINGKVFYSGRDAFQAERPVYILGYNPGGDPDEHAAETIQNHTQGVLKILPPNWSAYRDESWFSRGFRQPAGTATFQPVILQLMHELGIDPGLTPSSNLVFVRSPRAAHLNSSDELEQLCWPFHANVIELINPHFIICFGLNTGRFVRARLRANEILDRFEEPNSRHWTSDARENADGRIVFTLTHPSQAKWTTRKTDPRPMVLRVVKNRQ
jgi:hypothetical protein